LSYVKPLHEVMTKEDMANVIIEQIQELDQLIAKVERYEKALKTIKEIGDYYTEKGWALNPDKIDKIIDNVLENQVGFRTNYDEKIKNYAQNA
jgi:signal transduction histidine kinase